MIITLENGASEDIPIDQIDGVKIYTVNNLYSYDYQQCRNIIQQNISTEPITHYYFIFESLYNDSFGHWMSECGILLPIFIKLKLTYPTLKLHLKTKRSYKTHILTHLNIDLNDISYDLEPNNKCFVVEPFTSLHNKSDCSLHIQYFIQYYTILRPSVLPEKNIDILFLPRQTKENYISNDRVHHTQEIEYYISNLPNCVVLHTDKLTDFKTQVDLILRAKTIILTDGSPFFINSLIAMNSKIICLGNIMGHQIHQFSELRHQVDIIKSNSNTIQILDSPTYTYRLQDVISLLA
jgi:hypothetical protein